MSNQSTPPSEPHKDEDEAIIYSTSQDKDGSYTFTRSEFLQVCAAIGGALLIQRLSPKLSGGNTGKASSGVMSPRAIHLHTEPNSEAKIADVLQQGDLVRLINDRTQTGWVEVITRHNKRGWLQSSYVDFTHAIRSNSPDFSTINSSIAQKTPMPGKASIQLSKEKHLTNNVVAPQEEQVCGEAIQNGDFESGNVAWLEESTGTIIRNDWPDPYQGSWVAWLGGLGGYERLTQTIYIPINVKDAQKLEFYLKVTSEEVTIQVHDTLSLRFLDAGGNPISSDIPIASDLDRSDWQYQFVDLTGLQTFAAQNIQIQFEGAYNTTRITNFVLDLVSLNLSCDPITPTPTSTATKTPTPVYYVYLPLIVQETPPAPTSTPTPTATSCSGYCGYDCPSDCGYDCPYECVYDCPSECTFECIYECTFECIYDCPYNW